MLNSNKIQNEDILALLTQVHLEMAVKMETDMWE